MHQRLFLLVLLLALMIPASATSAQTAAPYSFPAQAQSNLLEQWATEATGSTQYSDTDWNFSQATGEPNTTECGDIGTAWASLGTDLQPSLTLFFAQPVIPTQVNIYQTYNPGAIVGVEVGMRDGDMMRLFNSADPVGNTPCPGVFTVDITSITTPVNTVVIRLDQNITQNWDEIDAVQLVGTPVDGTDTETVTTSEPTATGEILFQDDFSDPASGWAVVPNFYEGSIGYGTGDYVVRSTTQNTTMPALIYQNFTDIDLEVDATQTLAPANNNNGYGVVCRIQSDNFSGYILRISGDGRAAIHINEPTGTTTALSDWAMTPAVVQGNATNHLRAVCNGSTLELYVNGTLVASATDSTFAAGTIGPAVSSFEVDPTEVHFDNLVVTAPGSDTATVPQPTSPPASNAQVTDTEWAAPILLVGDSIQDSLSPDIQTRLYVFNGNAGDVVTLDMASTEMDPYLLVLGPQGQYIAANDDIDPSADLSSRISDITLPVTGSYLVVASTWQYITTTGSGGVELTQAAGYTLSLSGTSAVENPESFAFDVMPLTSGTPLQSDIAQNQEARYFIFTGRQGDVVDLTMDGTFDTILSVYAPGGIRLGINDDIDYANDNRNSALTGLQLPEDGVYFVVATNPYLMQIPPEGLTLEAHYLGGFNISLTVE